MNSREITFQSGPYRGWKFSMSTRGEGDAILIQIETCPRLSVNGAMSCAAVLSGGQIRFTVHKALRFGPGQPLTDTLTAVLGALPDVLHSVHTVTPLQQAHVDLIRAEGAQARKTYERDYPAGEREPFLEVVGRVAVVVEPSPEMRAHAGHLVERYAEQTRARSPHNEEGTTDDFRG